MLLEEVVEPTPHRKDGPIAEEVADPRLSASNFEPYIVDLDRERQALVPDEPGECPVRVLAGAICAPRHLPQEVISLSLDATGRPVHGSKSRRLRTRQILEAD